MANDSVSALRLVLGDQLSHTISSLRDLDAGRDVVLMVEVQEEATYVRHHKQKIVLVLSAMRHFADRLRQRGIEVDYVRLDDAGNTGSFSGELRRALQRHGAQRVVVTEPSEWRVQQMVDSWATDLGVPVEVRNDDRFLCSRADFASWAEGRKGLRMEFFYRFMRRRTGWLMEGGEPAGGRWNFDTDNRKALPADVIVPARPRYAPDAVTREVMALVSSRFADHFGDLEAFGWPVTREQARAALTHFIADCLPRFGDYQDAMRVGDDLLFHSLLSPALNLGLLLPTEACEAAVAAYEQGHAPLSAVEGFVRQVLGWREFVRGIYWLHMPAYVESNFLQAQRDLPGFYWSGDTDMRCLRHAIDSTRRHAYAHHIQRLMVTGNFALLAGISPQQVHEWYLGVYADAFEWVELPNTLGMALHADGGVVGSKPYAASGAYVKRMSDACGGCTYDPDVKLGPGACPLNFLYWNFLIRNESRLRGNPRMSMPYRTLQRMSTERRQAIVAQAGEFLRRLEGSD